MPKKLKAPLPEGMIWLLMTGDVPSNKQVEQVAKILEERSEVGKDLEEFIRSLIKRTEGKMRPIFLLS